MMRRLGAKNTAPGLDSIPGKALVKAQGVLAPALRQIFDTCLRKGSFPRERKVARLMFLRKEGKPANSLSAYRPICLLSETGKLFERIIAARLATHLSRTGPSVSPRQHWFREGHSTIDAFASPLGRGGIPGGDGVGGVIKHLQRLQFLPLE